VPFTQIPEQFTQIPEQLPPDLHKSPKKFFGEKSRLLLKKFGDLCKDRASLLFLENSKELIIRIVGKFIKIVIERQRILFNRVWL